MSHQNKSLTIALTVIRIFVGVLFIFSGLIKANDPSGLAYKMGEFFEIWAKDGYMPSLMHMLDQYKLFFSIMMITFEIVAGIALIIGYRFKLFSFLILALTIFFTFLTGYAMYSGKVKECGCFGDCIKLQANESFMKDLILLALLLILVFFRKKIAQAFSNKIATTIMVLTLLLTLFVQWYALKHLPYKDCLAYRVGNNLYNEMTPGKDYIPEVYENLLTYKNKKTGELKDFDQNNFPWQDTVNWEFAENKSKLVSPAKNEPPIKDFVISNYNGEDITQTILKYPGNVFILFVKDVDEANTSNIATLRTLEADCKKANIPLIAISSSNDVATKAFNAKHQLNLDFYSIDGTVCKTAMRTNPGLMHIKNGTVLNKWSYADYPNLSKLNIDMKDNSTPLFPVLSTIQDSIQP
jgi:uncharacterized membrane protein YphA (DoxX/SURF4 family)/peroxiredoxin